MKNRSHSETEHQALPADVAERLLARAAELDSKQRIDAEIARLREASTEAGMLPSAFDAALAELRAEGTRLPAKATGRGSRRITTLVLAALVALAAIVTMRRVVPAPASGLEQAFRLQCMQPREAATLLTLSIGNPAMQLTIPPEGASHILTVRTKTRAQMDEIRARLDQMDGGSCVTPVAARPVQ